jgi:hypothetical protein
MSSRVVFLAIMVFVPLWGFSESAFRVFEAQGRAVEARIIQVDPSRGMVELELRNKQRKKVKVAIFREVDQDYIRDWNVVQEFMSQSFKIEPVKNIMGTKKEMLGSQKAIRRDTKQICYDIKISNRTGVSIDGLTLKYNIFYEQEELGRGDNIQTKRYVYGSDDLTVLNARQNKEVQTKVFEVYNQRLAGGYDEYTGGSPTNQSGKTKGIWIKVFLKTPSGLTATREVCLPKTMKNQLSWQSES